MTAKLDKLVIDRQRWARGESQSTRLLGEDGKLCCLGFCMAQLGVSRVALLGQGLPHEAIDEQSEFLANVEGTLVTTNESDDGEGGCYLQYADTELVTEAINANDASDITEAEREERIKANRGALRDAEGLRENMSNDTQWYIVGPISQQMRDRLLTAKRQLTTRAAAITADLNQVAELLGQAAIAYEKDDLPAARKALKEACDLEYETLGECEASGELSEALFPDGSPDDGL